MGESSGVTFKRAEYLDNLPRWKHVDDAESSLRGVEDEYLPFFGANVEGDNVGTLTGAEATRFHNYKLRAVFYNYVARTNQGLTGAANDQALIFETGNRLEYARDNIDGRGTSLAQQVRRVTSRVINHGRHGLFVDFPQAEGTISQAQIDSGQYNAVALSYGADAVINWGYTEVGAQVMLSLVVLVEHTSERAADGFTVEAAVRYRVLRLEVEGGTQVYTQQLYDNKGQAEGAPITPRDSGNRPLTFIPFTFVGSVNNDAEVDESIMYDMAVLNTAHYRNSADYENTAWLCGQPQPWVTGLTQSWVDSNLKGVALFGSGTLLPFPAGAEFGIAQVTPNAMSFEAMGHKQNQMLAMGAKMVDPNSAVFKTATEASINDSADKSFLEAIQENVEAAYRDVLGWMGMFTGETTIEFSNPTDLQSYSTNPEMLGKMLEAMFAEVISKADVRDWMRKNSLAERSDEDMDGELEASPPGIDLDNDADPVDDGEE